MPIRVLAVSAVTAGLAVVTAQAAQASGGGSLYVSTTGTGVNCAQANPCPTISAALALAHAGTTIHVARGRYTEQLSIGNADDHVTIIGAGPTKTIVQPPASGLLSDTDTDGTDPQYYVVDVAPNTTGVNIKQLGVDGASAASFFDSDNLGCAQDFVGVYFHDASGSLNHVNVTGADLPADLASCQNGLGIYVASDSGSTSSVTMGSVKLPTEPGAAFGSALPPAYDKNGITCDDPGTTCTINNSQVQGIGSTGVVAQNGIQVFGASATIHKTRVMRNTYNAGGNGNQATGILVLNAGTLSLTSNTIASNDIDIYAGLVPDFGLMPPSIGTWTISGNKANHGTDAVSGGEVDYGEGIELDSTTNDVEVLNNVTDSNTQAGILMLGATNATIRGNNAQGNEVGLYVGGPGTAVTSSSDNTISGNTFLRNTAGVIADGAFSPEPPIGNGSNPNAAFDNTFSGNTWNGNAVNAADFSGWAGSDPPSPPVAMANTWGSPNPDFSCEPTAGGSTAVNTATGGPFLYAC